MEQWTVEHIVDVSVPEIIKDAVPQERISVKFHGHMDVSVPQVFGRVGRHVHSPVHRLHRQIVVPFNRSACPGVFPNNIVDMPVSQMLESVEVARLIPDERDQKRTAGHIVCVVHRIVEVVNTIPQ